MKKILILTVTAGNAHNACAKAMKEKLESMSDVEVKVIDLLKEYSKALKVWTADKGYNIAVAHFRHVYNMFYEIYKNVPPEDRYKCAAQGMALSVLDGLLKEIYTFKRDVIYGTHFYAGIALTDLKLVYNIPCKVIITSLDYCLSPFWEACVGVDYFALPCEDFIEESIQEGFKLEQLVVSGIPVNEKFYVEKDKKEAKEELGLNPNVFTIMIMFGGGHWAGGFKIFKELIEIVQSRNVQIIMINGRNKEGFNKVAKMHFPDNIKVINVGFTNQVDLYMSASDIMLNKAGGSSCTEIINKKLPMIVTEILPAQEKHNLKFLKEKGIVKSFKNKKELKEIIFDLMDHKDHYDKMVANTLLLRRNGIDILANLILSQPNAIYNDEYISNINYKKVVSQVKKALTKEHKTTKKEVKIEKKEVKKKLKQNGGKFKYGKNSSSY